MQEAQHALFLLQQSAATYVLATVVENHINKAAGGVQLVGCFA